MNNQNKYKNSTHQLLTMFIIALLTSSCYTQKDKSFFQDLKSLPHYEKSAYDDYKIEVNDEILFRVTTTDEKFVELISSGSGTQQQGVSYRVFPDGTIDLPYIDSIKVAGLTIPEATEVIQKRFQQLISDADVKIALSNKSYTVVGDAGTGIFPVYKEKLNIFQALAQSGPIALSGDRKHIKILRERDGKREMLEFDIRPKSVIDSKYYYIYPNDIIYVQRESSSFYKTNNYGTFLGLITSSVSLLTTVIYFAKQNNSSTK